MKRTSFPPRAETQRPSFPLILVGILMLAGALWVLLWMKGFTTDTDFRNNLWGPAHLLVQGRSPYRVEVLYEGKLALWLPQAIGLFFPLGFLDLAVAANLWFLLNVGLLLGLAWWFGRDRAKPLPPLAAILAATLPPVLFHFFLGQFSLLAAALSLLAAHLAGRRRCFYAGLLIALALAKPQLALLAAPGLWLSCWRQGGRRGAILFPLAAGLGSIVLSLPLWIGYPHWIPDFLEGFRRNPPWQLPNLFSMLGTWWGAAGWALAALVALGLSGLNLWLWYKYPPEEALPWSLALTTLASPYIWTWDFMLFLPLIWRSLAQQRSRPARVLWIAGLMLCWGLTMGLTVWVTPTEGEISYHWHFWMPWLFLALVWGGRALERAAARRQQV